MCGRFGLEETYVQLALRYQAELITVDPGPRYNIAPTQPVAVVVEREGRRVLDRYRWGLVPGWARDRSIGQRLINARAETAATLPSFRTAFRQQRCVIPATRYYEWKRVGTRKVPYTITHPERIPLSFAGLWDRWRDPTTGEDVYSCAIITTAATAALAAIHDRMPAILPVSAVATWLDPSYADVGALQAVLRPADTELQVTPVSRRVNDPRNDDPEILRPEWDVHQG